MFAMPSLSSIYLAAAIAAVAGFGVQTARISGFKSDLSEAKATVDRERKDYADERTAAAAAALQRSRDDIMKANAAAAAQKENEDAQRKRDQDYAADLARARDADSRLRARLAEAIAAAGRARGAAAPAGAGQPSQAASGAEGMLADVLGRCVSRVRLLAEFADTSRNAGLRCEADYDALIRVHNQPPIQGVP